MVKRKMTKLLIHADVIADNAREQVENTAKSPALQGLIAIMPDVHFGAGSVIGFTGKFKDAVIPNIVGVDNGCGVSCYELGKIDIDFSELDKYIRKSIPLGMNRRKTNTEVCGFIESETVERMFILEKRMTLSCPIENIIEPWLQYGTLGGGNHFIEIDQNSKGERFLIIHSGSRNYGLKVANHFQKLANKICKDRGIETGKNLQYLPMEDGGNDYMKYLYISQEFAKLNREVMCKIILGHFNIEFSKENYIESVHNFISRKDNIIRKGAISAHKGEKVIIPLNMAEGCIIGTGKGIPEYNFSAPHGAGRIFGRKEMGRKLDNPEDKDITMDAFKNSMDGVFSTCIHESTIDESPFAYKKYESIEKHVKETIDIEDILKPIYNLKG